MRISFHHRSALAVALLIAPVVVTVAAVLSIYASLEKPGVRERSDRGSNERWSAGMPTGILFDKHAAQVVSD